MTLATEFQSAERPVVLVELEFDSAPIFFWTRPFTGQFNGNTYRPLEGLTGSLSIRQSLDRPSLDAGAQIVGTADEIKAAAVQEEFQLRPARIKLAAVDAAGAIVESEELLSGKMQDISAVSDPESGVSLSVVIESIFAEISIARDLRLSAADQAAFDPNDSFFDFVETAKVNEPPFGG